MYRTWTVAASGEKTREKKKENAETETQQTPTQTHTYKNWSSLKNQLSVSGPVTFIINEKYSWLNTKNILIYRVCLDMTYFVETENLLLKPL